MTRSRIFAWPGESFACPPRSFDGKRRRCQNRLPVRLQLETLEDRVVPTAPTFTLPIVNQTGLNASQYSIYALGFSTASQMELQSNGQFASFPSSSGSIPSYNISTLPNITLDTGTSLQGAIVFFFVVPNGQTPPSFAYSNNGSNVVQPTTFSPPYGIVEITENGGGALPTIDVSAVNGFSVPITLTLNNSLGQVGQPLSSPSVDRADILKAFTTFMNGQGAAGTPYQDLVFGPNGIAGQADAILSPNQYLSAGANASSALNSVWNSALTTLFNTPGRTLSMIGDDGDYYKGAPTTVSIAGNTYNVIQFVGYTNSAETTPNNNTFNIFSPLTPDPSGSYQNNESAGEMVFANDGVFADSSTNVLNGSTGPMPTAVALGLERDIVAALNRGVALLGPTDGLSGDNSTYWGTETNWYPAGQTENLYALFLHTATINGTPIFALPSGAVTDAQGTLMASAYAFPYDENPVHSLPNQPEVPSKFDPVPAGTTMATITLAPWFPPAQSPSPSPSPSGPVALLFMAEDEFALVVDNVFSRFSNDPFFTQAGDRIMNIFDNLLHLDNPALGSGTAGLQSAIHANPYYGTQWGELAEMVGLDLALTVLNPPNQS